MVWRLFRKKVQAVADPNEHSVMIHLKLWGGEFGSQEERDAVHGLSRRLAEAIAIAKAGYVDGDEFGAGEGVLYIYGPDADRMMPIMAPIMRESPVCEGGWAVKRHGPSGSRAETIALILN